MHQAMKLLQETMNIKQVTDTTRSEPIPGRSKDVEPAQLGQHFCKMFKIMSNIK